MTSRSSLTAAEAEFVQRQRVGRLATSDLAGSPSVVPVCYAFDGARFYTPLDEKPKSVEGRRLRRVRNIEARAEASLVIDAYDDDWSRLGYVLASGRAALVEPEAPEHSVALRLLRERYPQYRGMRLEEQPIIALDPEHVTSWGPALSDQGETQLAAPWLQPGRGTDFLALARGRRSVRSFEDRPVPRAALDAMLEAARWAPSPHGRQPWRFAVITRQERKDALAAAMGDDWQRTLELDRQSPEVIQTRLLKSHERIRTAPALILACLYLEGLDVYPDAERQRAEEIMAIQSLGAAVQNMLLAAFSVGLDCGWMCAPLFSPETVRAALDLDSALIPHALLPVGYAARDPKRRPHRPADELTVLFD